MTYRPPLRASDNKNDNNNNNTNDKIPQKWHPVEITIEGKSKYLKGDILAECLANNNMPRASLQQIKPHLSIENDDNRKCWMLEEFLPPFLHYTCFNE